MRRRAGGRARTVTVVGRGVTSAPPDLAEINAGLQARAPAVGEAATRVNEGMTALLTALASLGVAERDVQTVEYHVGSEWDAEDRASEYRVLATVSVRLRDITQLGATIDALVAAGATEIYGVRFGLADRDDLARRARAAAMADARQRAEDYAQHAGLAVGEVMRIREHALLSGPRAGQNRALAFARSGAGDGTPVAEGELEVAALVEVVFRMRTR